MHLAASASSFGVDKMIVASSIAAILCAVVVHAQVQLAPDASNCRVECYPNTRMINSKGINRAGVEQHCRWILRTDGKPARLCDHIKCQKVCPNSNNNNNNLAEQQEAAATSASSFDSSAMLRIEQRLENNETPREQPAPRAEAMGIMRHLHGHKLALAPVPGVSGGSAAAGRVAAGNQAQAGGNGARRMAPTLPPAIGYDDKDTPPPISRFLDISPEE